LDTKGAYLIEKKINIVTYGGKTWRSVDAYDLKVELNHKISTALHSGGF